MYFVQLFEKLSLVDLVEPKISCLCVKVFDVFF